MEDEHGLFADSGEMAGECDQCHRDTPTGQWYTDDGEGGSEWFLCRPCVSRIRQRRAQAEHRAERVSEGRQPPYSVLLSEPDTDATPLEIARLDNEEAAYCEAEIARWLTKGRFTVSVVASNEYPIRGGSYR